MKIKINGNCYREFNSMIQTCANDREDEIHGGLFTALYNAKYVGGKGKAWVAELNPEQIKQFVHMIDKQSEYMEFVTIDEMKSDQSPAKAIKEIRYDIWCLRKLMTNLEQILEAK